MKSAFFLIAFFFGAPVFAVSQYSGGIAFMEEGDDRIRRGVVAGFETEKYLFKGFFFRRTFGPVSEQTQMLSLARLYKLPYLGASWMSVGGVLLQEQTATRYNETIDSKWNKSRTYANAGLSCGVYWRYKVGKKMVYKAAWESFLFAAGFFPGLLLATGRKQSFTFQIGYQI